MSYVLKGLFIYTHFFPKNLVITYKKIILVEM